jgi:hypothetical protein
VRHYFPIILLAAGCLPQMLEPCDICRSAKLIVKFKRSVRPCRGVPARPCAWAKEKPAQTAGQISKVREPSEGNSRNGEPYRLLCNMGSDPCSSSAWLYMAPSGQCKAYRDVKSRPC